MCNIFCSVPDPQADNESHRGQKHGDSRCICISQQFECPSCGKTFAKPSELQEHMLNHTQEASLSLISQAGSDYALLMEENDFQNETNVSQNESETLED